MTAVLRRPYTQKPPAGVRPNLRHPQLRGCVAWWPFLGNARDVIGNSHGVITGGPTWKGSPKGRALNFSGTDQFIELGSIPSTHPLSLQTGNGFSVAFWLKHPNTGDASQRIIDKSSGGPANSGWSIWVSTYPRLGLGVNGDPSGPLSTGFSTNVWYHHVVTFRESTVTDAVSYYIDGAFDLSGDLNTTLPTTTTDCRIGALATGDTRDLKGELVDLRVYDRPISAVEVRDIYENTWAPFERKIYLPLSAAEKEVTPSYFLPLRRPYSQKPPAGVQPNRGHPQLKGCVGWWPFLGGASRDYINNNHGVFAGGAGYVATDRGLAADFDGDNGYIDLGTIATTNPLCLAGSTTMSITAWIFFEGLGVNNFNQIIEKANTGGSNSPDGWGLTIDDFANPDRLGFNVDTKSGTFSDTEVPKNVWSHIAITFNTDWSNDQIFYLNGQFDGNNDHPTITTLPTVETPAKIGVWSWDPGSNNFAGQMLDLRVYDRALTDAEVRDIYENTWAPFERRIFVPRVVTTGIKNDRRACTG